MGVGDGTEFVIRPVLDRVGDEDAGGVGAEGAGLRFGGFDELGGGDHHRWDAA